MLTTYSTESNLYEAVEAMIVKFCGILPKNVRRGFPTERVPLPKSKDYAIMTVLGDSRDCSPTVRWNNSDYTVEQRRNSNVQIDFYGENAKRNADIISNIARSSVLCDFWKNQSISPLYCDEAENLTGVGGEEKYVPRWVIRLSLTYLTGITVENDYFESVDLDKIKNGD